MKVILKLGFLRMKKELKKWKSINEWIERKVHSCCNNSKCPIKKLKMKVPEEAWCARKPSVKHLKVFGSICFKHILDQRRTKLRDKSMKMIFIGYHSTGGYKLYNPVDKNLQISRDMVFDESETWKWEAEGTKEGEVKQIFAGHDEDSDGEMNGENIEIDEVVSAESHTNERTQRRRQTPRRLEDCEVLPDSAVSNEGDLLHFAF